MGCQCFRAGVCNGTIVHVRVITVTKVLLCTCKYICVCICIGLLYISAKKKQKRKSHIQTYVPQCNCINMLQLYQASVCVCMCVIMTFKRTLCIRCCKFICTELCIYTNLMRTPLCVCVWIKCKKQVWECQSVQRLTYTFPCTHPIIYQNV